MRVVTARGAGDIVAPMGTTRFVAVLLGLVVAASAQQVKPAPPAPQVQFARPAASTVIRPTQLARYELPPASAKGQRIPVDASDRLAPVLRHLLCGADDAAAQPTVRHASSSRGSWMFVVGTAEQVATANRVVAQLAQDLPLQARLQCSLVTLPLAIAR